MHDSKCDLNELFIEQFIDNELDFKESSDVSAHIETCQKCKDVYEEINFIRNVMKTVKKNEMLSPIEKEGFYNLIEKSKKKEPLFSKIRKFFFDTNYKVTILASSSSFVILGFAFAYMLFNVDQNKNLIIQEILSAHNNNFPEEFSVTENDESVAGGSIRQLKMDKKVIRELTRISPVLKGRYTSIAAQPMAKIKFEDDTINAKGTLLMSRKSARIKDVFQDGNCVVKHEDGKSCKAVSHNEDGKDIVYWESNDNEFVFVSDDKKLHSRMIKLINNY